MQGADEAFVQELAEDVLAHQVPPSHRDRPSTLRLLYLASRLFLVARLPKGSSTRAFAIPPAIKAQIDSELSFDRLDGWLRAAVTAALLDAVFRAA